MLEPRWNLVWYIHRKDRQHAVARGFVYLLLWTLGSMVQICRRSDQQLSTAEDALVYLLSWKCCASHWMHLNVARRVHCLRFVLIDFDSWKLESWYYECIISLGLDLIFSYSCYAGQVACESVHKHCAILMHGTLLLVFYTCPRQRYRRHFKLSINFLMNYIGSLRSKWEWSWYFFYWGGSMCNISSCGI